MSNRIYNVEISRSVGITQEASIVSCHFSNALNTFQGNSIVVTDRIEKDQYRRFLVLKDKWESETLFMSSSTDIFNNSAYKKIIRQGEMTIPWIIKDLKKSNNHWFYALKAITGVNPIKPENYGIVGKMKEDWLHWAEQNNY